MATSQTINIIDPGGDLIVRITVDRRDESLLVSSKILEMASKTMAKKIKALNTANIIPYASAKELDMTADDGDAILTICNILHGRKQEIPTKISLHLLESIAHCYAKYGFADAVSSWGCTWLAAMRHEIAKPNALKIRQIILDMHVSLDLLAEEKPHYCIAYPQYYAAGTGDNLFLFSFFVG